MFFGHTLNATCFR